MEKRKNDVIDILNKLNMSLHNEEIEIKQALGGDLLTEYLKIINYQEEKINKIKRQIDQL